MQAKFPWQEVEVKVTHAAANVNSNWIALENATELGLFVPTLATVCTVTLQVARDSSGTNAVGLVNQAGTAILVLASGSGGVAISSNELGALLAYPFFRVVLGANQAADVSFWLQKKCVAVDPFA